MAAANSGYTQRASESRRQKSSDRRNRLRATYASCADLTKIVVSTPGPLYLLLHLIVNEPGVPALIEELK